MTKNWSVLCPIDFSDASRGALRHALVLARRFHASVTLLTVEDPLLAEVGDGRMGAGWTRAKNENELRGFLSEIIGSGFTDVPDVHFEVAVGKPGPLILAAARAAGSHLIVMSTHGRSGLSKLFLGTTTERVLRETTTHVLLTPPEDPGPQTFDELVAKASPALIPVDFSAATATQVQVANTLAEAHGLKLLVGHVIEPLKLPISAPVDGPELLAERHRRACCGLEALDLRLPSVDLETLISQGDPVEEIARWIRDKHVGLLVMALHAGAEGARMGSVTYRTLCRSRVLTLALAPK